MKHSSVVHSQHAFLLLSQLTARGRRESLEWGRNKARGDQGTSISPQQSTSHWIKHFLVPVSCSVPSAHNTGLSHTVVACWLLLVRRKWSKISCDIGWNIRLWLADSPYQLPRWVRTKTTCQPPGSACQVQTRVLGERWGTGATLPFLNLCVPAAVGLRSALTTVAAANQ